MGSGFLGTQIGALSAKSDYSVSMYDVYEDAFEVSKRSVEEYLEECSRWRLDFLWPLRLRQPRLELDATSR